MGDTARRVFAGQPGARRSLARGTSLPAAPATLTASMLRLVERLRAADEPAAKCSSPWCPRRPMPNGDRCATCARRGPDPVEAELSAAGWEPVLARGKRQGWRDPVTGTVLAARVAVVVVRRDAARSGK